jgi:hypothetical protein
MTATPEENAIRTKALIGLVVTLVISVAAWFGLSTVTQRGVDRLAAIDRARARCAGSWTAARSRAETLLVDAIALADTIDPRSDQALAQCGDLRDKGSVATPTPNPREMNGQPMPRGLR